jgi:hypothetical protein
MLHNIEQIFPHLGGNFIIVNNILFPFRLNTIFLKCAAVLWRLIFVVLMASSTVKPNKYILAYGADTK